jgi:hypothetical protein
MILKDIYEKSNMRWRIHVSNSKFRDYLCSEDLGDCTEADPKLAQWIHACSWKEEKATSNGPAMASRKIPCQPGNFEVLGLAERGLLFFMSRSCRTSYSYDWQGSILLFLFLRFFKFVLLRCTFARTESRKLARWTGAKASWCT